jgi:hypothetical protein
LRVESAAKLEWNENAQDKHNRDAKNFMNCPLEKKYLSHAIRGKELFNMSFAE